MTATLTITIHLERTEDLSPTVRAFHFVVPAVERFEFTPGQWVSLLLPITAPDRARAYSVASPARNDNRFELAVTLVPGGPGSTYLFGLKPGAELKMVGPQGFLALKDTAIRAQAFVATGTGVTPFRSMIHALLTGGTDHPVTLIFGARTEADILYRAEFEQLARTLQNFRFIPTLSRAGDDWAGPRGYVQAHVRERLAGATDTVVYVCGLKRMVNDVKALLREELGFPRARVVTERYD